MMKKAIYGIVVVALAACGNTDPEKTPSLVEPASDALQPEDSVQVNSYQSYCFKRVGQIGGQSTRGEACDAGGGGRADVWKGSPDLRAILPLSI